MRREFEVDINGTAQEIAVFEDSPLEWEALKELTNSMRLAVMVGDSDRWLELHELYKAISDGTRVQ